MAQNKPDSDWELLPLQGLGRLRFGMSREEVAGLNSIYGKMESVLEDETLTFADFLRSRGLSPLGISLEQKNDLEKAFARQKSQVTEYRMNSLFQMDFAGGALSSFTLGSEIRRLCLKGQKIFNLPAQDAVKLLSLELDEPPLAFEEDLVFPASCLYLWNFSFASPKTGLSFTTKSQKKFRERSISWSVFPRVTDEDFSSYLAVPL